MTDASRKRSVVRYDRRALSTGPSRPASTHLIFEKVTVVVVGVRANWRYLCEVACHQQPAYVGYVSFRKEEILIIERMTSDRKLKAPITEDLRDLHD